MQIIPLQAVANQAVTVSLGGQNTQINIYQKLYGLFVDLYVSGALVIAGTPALDRTLIVRSTYLGFAGDLVFIDTQGTENPTYTGLGTRFRLAYVEASELIASDLSRYAAAAIRAETMALLDYYKNFQPPAISPPIDITPPPVVATTMDSGVFTLDAAQSLF